MSKSTRFSRSKASAALLLVVLAGCASPGKVTVSPADGTETEVKLEKIGFERLEPFDDLALVYGERTLRLGTDKHAALEVFEQPAKAFALSSLPQQFGEQFSAFGWETDAFSFGGIAYEEAESALLKSREQVVLAMYSADDVDEDTVQATVETYRGMYGDPSAALPGSRIAYWFWTKPGRRLMVNMATDTKGKRSLTVAVGEPQVMTLLRMEPTAAKQDKDSAVSSLSALSQG